MALSQEDPQEELQYWLANEDWYPSRFTQNWLRRTPPAEVAETLNLLAQQAQPQPPGLLSRIGIIFATTGFATSSGITGGGPKVRKAGVRAALMLGDLNDLRAITPLVRVFDPYGFWQSKYQKEIEVTLTRLLSQATEQGAAAYRMEVQTLVNRILQDSRKRNDLSGPLTDLLITALNYLAAIGDEENQTFLANVAATFSATFASRSGNWARVKATLKDLQTSKPA
jgi:hypothetical protein